MPTEPNGSDKAPSDQEPILNLPEDPGKSWDSGQSSVLNSFATGESVAQPPGADAASLDATFVIPEADAIQPQLSGMEPGARLILRKKLGSGGFGEVWEAVQERLGRAVAVKKVRLDLCDMKDPNDARHTFIDENLRQEAHIAASLDHPNIVPVYDLQSDARGFPALAMKLVRGRAWDDVITKDTTSLSREEFLSKHIPILIGVSQAVAFAHSRGIIHRDLKPAQVMIGDFGEVLLMDWGLGIVFRGAEAQHADNLPLPEFLPTAESASNPAGTIAYMAPEQTDPTAAKIGPWTDVFLLGGILYKLLTGRSPHSSNSPHECFELAKAGVVIPPRERAPGLEMPQELVDLCELSLNREIARRPQNAKEFLDLLQGYHSGSARRQQSRELTEEARKLIAGAEGSYSSLSRCDELLSRAHDLWPDNKDTAELSRTVSTEFARAAIASGDLQLARLLAGKLPEGADRQSLVLGIETAERVRRQRDRQRRIALVTTIAALLVIVAGALYYNRRVSQAHRSAVVARADAETLISGLQDNLFEELQSAGQVKVLHEFDQEVDSYFSRLDAKSSSPETRLRHLSSILSLQQAQSRIGETSTARVSAERAVKMAEELLAAKPADPLYLAMAARAQCRYADMLFHEGNQRDRALEVARSAAHSIDVLDPSRFSDLRSGVVAARTAQDLSSVFLFMEGDTTTAARLLSHARIIRDRLLEKYPDNQTLIEGRSVRLLRSAVLSVGTGKLDDALAELKEALSIRTKIAEKSPNNMANRAEIARTLFWVGRTHERIGDTTTALETHRQALGMREELAANDPEDLTLRWETAASRAKIAELRFNLGDAANAEAELSATLSILGQAQQKAVGHGRDFDLAAACAHLVKGRILESRGDTASAREEWNQAVNTFKKLEEFAPYEYFMLRSYAEALLRLDRLEEAEAVAAKLRHLGYKAAILSQMLQAKGLQPL